MLRKRSRRWDFVIVPVFFPLAANMRFSCFFRMMEDGVQTSAQKSKGRRDSS